MSANADDRIEELLEEVLEPDVIELTEDKAPASAGLWKPTTKPGPHIDKVRREVALWVVIPLVSLYAVVILAATFLPISPDRFTALIAGLATLSGLAGAVIGFYFGQSTRDPS